MCYQTPIRDAGNQANDDYDMEAMKRALAEENYQFTIGGGEPLMTPIDDLEELWRWGHERYGQNAVQTSATTVTERHFELFQRYNVSVGISLEGPGELNDIRWAGSLKRTREASRSAEAVLHRLLEERHSVSLITTLNRANAAPDRLPRLLNWYRDLDSRGLRHVNLHLMEIETEQIRDEWALSEEENAGALLACAELQAELEHLRFQPITDMVQLLLGDDRETSCIWNACDPMTTRAVHGVNGQGDRINCSRTNKAGVDVQKADQELLVRPLALYHTPQEHGGCQNCRFWFACKGSCPGESIHGDSRLKTEHCGTLQRVFGELETRLASLGFRPVSLDENRRKMVEARLLEAFAQGVPLRVHAALNGGAPAAAAKHGDTQHGDRDHQDHGDSEKPVLTHGDHTDQTLVP
ncbi:hypothetical protein LCGC14_2293540 [marine sediment metagenome]|uniref:Radical SAM core domain-containing protein n=1 Tax=marine sediment metagenome TaxID=412755 RepID=A0A0F9CQI0_9ZZZZ